MFQRNRRRTTRNMNLKVTLILVCIAFLMGIPTGAYLISIPCGGMFNLLRGNCCILQVQDETSKLDGQESTDLGIPLEGRISVTLARHIDGDTTRFYINGVETRVRYLAIDAEEIRGEDATELGRQASEFVRNRLEQAEHIELEFDPSRDPYDRFGRVLAWVWVDGTLLQEELVRLGYAEIRYTQGNELYLDKLEEAVSFRR